MKRIIVTGGYGFIGSAFIRYIINNTSYSVLNIDNLSYSSNIESLNSIESNSRYEFKELDICNGDDILNVMQSYKPNAVIHFAAESHVDKSIDSPSVFIQTNIVGTYQLLQASLKYFNLSKATTREDFIFHHISTDEVYGDIGKDDLPANEMSKYAPSSPYSSSKASSDHLVTAWNTTFKLPTLITNCTNNYGYYQNQEKLIPHMIFRALNKQSMPIYGDGKQIRDWLHVDDHVRAIFTVMENGNIGESYNISGGNQISNIEIVEMICEHLNNLDGNNKNMSFDYKSLITFVKDRPGHDKRYALDSKKIYDEFGWEPELTFNEGIKKTILWYINNQDSYKEKVTNLERQGII